MKVIVVIFLIVGILCSSCSNLTVFQTARVIPKGESESGIGATFIHIDEKLYFSNIEFHYRRGLGKKFEVGSKIFGLPGLSGGFMGELKYQLIEKPLLVSCHLGGAGIFTKKVNYIEGYPMLILGNDRLYFGYRGIIRNATDEELKFNFDNYLNGTFIGYKIGKNVKLMPEIGYYFRRFDSGIFSLGLGIQFE